MNLLRYRLGFVVRESGQALERLGARLQGIYSYEEQIPKLMPVLNAELKLPKVAKNAWVAPSAQVSGDVKLGDSASVWYNATVRGDAQPVTIGAFSNLQDGACVGSLRPGGGGTRVGSHVSVGHNAVLQACTVGDRSLIGMNAVLADGVTVEPGAMVAAGTVVPAGTTVPSGELWGGNPARRLRALKPEEQAYLEELPQRYVDLAAGHETALATVRARMERLQRGELLDEQPPPAEAAAAAAAAK